MIKENPCPSWNYSFLVLDLMRVACFLLILYSMYCFRNHFFSSGPIHGYRNFLCGMCVLILADTVSLKLSHIELTATASESCIDSIVSVSDRMSCLILSQLAS